MKFATATMIVMIGLLAPAGDQHLRAKEPDFGDWKHDKVAAELIALHKEYMHLYEEWEKSIPENDRRLRRCEHLGQGVVATGARRRGSSSRYAVAFAISGDRRATLRFAVRARCTHRRD